MEFYYEGSHRSIEWRKWQEFEVHVPIWSPDPREGLAETWWRGKYKTSEIMRVMVQRMWPDVRIPYWFH
jgi:hypothetical protein